MRIPQLNLPNFQFTVAGSDTTLQIGIPESYIAEPINSDIHKYEGVIRDTNLEKIEIDNLVFSFREGGFALKGNVQTRFRKKILNIPIIGAIYTPWIAIKGSFTEELTVDVIDGRLAVFHSQLHFATTNDWYNKLVNKYVLPYLKKEVVSSLNHLLSDFNGMTIEELFIKYSQTKLQNTLGSRGLSQDGINKIFNLVSPNVPLSVILQRINKGLGLLRIHARVSNGHLWLSVVPD